jgi:hypothetical protein
VGRRDRSRASILGEGRLAASPRTSNDRVDGLAIGAEGGIFVAREHVVCELFSQTRWTV